MATEIFPLCRPTWTSHCLRVHQTAILWLHPPSLKQLAIMGFRCADRRRQTAAGILQVRRPTMLLRASSSSWTWMGKATHPGRSKGTKSLIVHEIDTGESQLVTLVRPHRKGQPVQVLRHGVRAAWPWMSQVAPEPRQRGEDDALDRAERVISEVPISCEGRTYRVRAARVIYLCSGSRSGCAPSRILHTPWRGVIVGVGQ